MDLNNITVQGKKAGFRMGRSGVDPRRNNLILVHGSGGSSMSWFLQTNGLDDDMNVIAVDLPGHGETPGGPIKRVEDYAAWLIEFIETAGLAPCFVGGHSLGGAIVQRLALDRPDLLKGILLIGTGAKLRVMPSILHTVLNDFYDALPVLVNYCYTKNAPKDLVGQAVEIMKEAGPQVLHDDFSACDTFDIAEESEKITLPTSRPRRQGRCTHPGQIFGIPQPENKRLQNNRSRKRRPLRHARIPPRIQRGHTGIREGNRIEADEVLNMNWVEPFLEKKDSPQTPLQKLPAIIFQVYSRTCSFHEW